MVLPNYILRRWEEELRRIEEEKKETQKNEERKQRKKEQRLEQWTSLIEPGLLILFETVYVPHQNQRLYPLDPVPQLCLGTIKRVELLDDRDLIPALILGESYLLHHPETVGGVEIPSVQRWAGDWTKEGEAIWEFSKLERWAKGYSDYIAKKVVELGGDAYKVYVPFIERMQPKEQYHDLLFYAFEMKRKIIR
ncbi:MAG: hypothetical protein Q7R76_05540 [Candidatus Woesearchaeota archaeon]|nr:hypothetical protein [Candidatus Woesearchaeota archaeon]